MSSFIPIKGKTGECDPHRPPVPEAYYTKRETDALLATKVSFDQFNNHTLNTTVHITAEERAAWNNKITEPEEEGSAGDVLVTDGEGGRTWSASPTHTATWGQITGTLSNQTDLHTRLTTDETNISNEVTRATSAEGLLGQRITTETTRATNAESVLTSSISAEVTRAQGAETTLTTNLSNEVTRATGVESGLNTSISNEVTRATGAEATLQSNITAENTRAEEAELLIQQNLESEATRAQGAESTLTTNLAAEVTRATGVEATKENVSNKVTEILSTSTHTEYASAKSVYDAISAIPKALVYKGTIGVGGTIQVLPEATEDRGGWTYKVITEAIYPPMTEKASIGDLIVCAWEEEPQPEGTYKWTLIPAGAEKVKDVQINGTSILSDAGIANIPYATSSSIGVVKGNTAYDVVVTSDGSICGYSRTLEQYAGRSNSAVIAKGTIENIKTDLTGRALADTAAPAYTTEQKTAAQNRLGVTEAIATETTRAQTAEAALQTAVDSKVADVKINGTTIVDENKCADIPAATPTQYGVLKASEYWTGLMLDSSGYLKVSAASTSNINARTDQFRPIVPYNLDYAVKAALTDGVGPAYTTEQKEAALTRLGAEGKKFYKCTYGTTTAEEIATALTNNLVPYVYTNDRYYFYSGSSSNYHFFNDVYSTGLSSTTSYCCFCDKSNNTWSSASRTLQQSNDRTDDILTNKTASTKYPSTKGVFDYAVGNVKVNGTALTKDENGDVNIPVATASTVGVVGVSSAYGTAMVGNNLSTYCSREADIDGRTQAFRPIVPSNLNYAVTAALTDSNKAVLTDTQKESAKNTIGVDTDINRIDNYIDGNLNGKTTNTEVANIKNLPTNVYSTTVNDIGGNSIVWNQLIQDPTFADASKWYSAYGTISGNKATVHRDAEVGITASVDVNPSCCVNSISGHKYLFIATVQTTNGVLNIIPTSVAYEGSMGYASYTTKTKIGYIWNCQVTNHITCSFRGYTGGSAITSAIDFTVENCCYYDLTLMFGAGNEPSTVAEFEAMFPNAYYPYSVPTVTHAAVDKVIYQGDGLTTEVNVPTAVQQLEGYGWGIGTVYNEVDYVNKKFIKRVGRVDLGIYDWSYEESTFKHTKPDSAKGEYKGICDNYQYVGRAGTAILEDKQCSCGGSGQYILIKDSSFNGDTAAFKAAMSGKYLYYELSAAVETDITSLLTNTDIIKDTVTKNHITAQFNNTLQLPMYNSITSTSKKSVVNDVTINNTSIVTDGVANIPIANLANKTPGLLYSDNYHGLVVDNNYVSVQMASSGQINNRNNVSYYYNSIVPYNLDYAVKAALTDGVGPAYTTTEQAAARTRIGAQKSKFFDVTYGTTTYQQISDAITAGKIPVCVYNVSSTETNEFFTYAGGNSSYHYLTAVATSGITTRYIRVNTSNTWNTNSNSMENPYRLREYNPNYVGSTGIGNCNLVAFDVDNRLIQMTTGNTTATTKVPSTVPFRPDALYYYAGSNKSEGATADSGCMYSHMYTSTVTYIFNESVPAYHHVYLCGSYSKETGLFTLDNGQTNGVYNKYYKFVPETSGLVLSNYFEAGKYYIKIGRSSTTTNTLQVSENKELFYFNGTSLVDGKEDFHVMDATSFESLPVKSGYYFVY